MTESLLVADSLTVTLGTEDPDILARPSHPYTRGLIETIPDITHRKPRLPVIEGNVPSPRERGPGCAFASRCRDAIAPCRDAVPPLLGESHRVACIRAHEVTEKLTVRFAVGGGFLKKPRQVQAVSDVSLTLQAGETLALVGESGSGKTTFARAMLGLTDITEGSVRFDGADVAAMSDQARKAMRRAVQVVFQDPFGSLDPRLPVGAIIAEPLRVHGIGGARERSARVAELLGLVGFAYPARPCVATSQVR
eukprot:gene5467-5523_t